MTQLRLHSNFRTIEGARRAFQRLVSLVTDALGSMSSQDSDSVAITGGTEDGVTYTNVDINSGAIDNTTIGAATPGAGTFTSVTVASTGPTITFKDTDCTDSDANATIVAAATDTGSTTEDVDVTLYQQIAGSLTAWLTADADGPIIFGSGRNVLFSASSEPTPASRLVVKASTNDGSTDGIVVQDSDGSEVLSVDSNGQMSLLGDIKLSEGAGLSGGILRTVDTGGVYFGGGSTGTADI